MDRQEIRLFIISALIFTLFFVLITTVVWSNKTHEISEPESIASSIESSSIVSSIEARTSTKSQPTTSFNQLDVLLKKAGSSIEKLQNTNSKQLVVVESSGNTASINFFELKDNQWIINDDLSCGGYVGVKGTTRDLHEGLNASPVGLYSIGDAFYINDKPETGLTSFRITNNTYWVDDPNSSFYNKRVEGTDNKDWKSAEHMIDYSVAYEYGFVINYNMQAVYNAGSAIFFHISSSPTAGCIGTSRKNTLAYLAALDASQNPYILIV